MKNIVYKILSLKPNEWKILICATLFIFILFASYATLRPIRDTLGIHNAEEHLK